MSKRADAEFLNDMLEAINRINAYTEKISYEKFLQDIKTQDAVVRNLEIMGEAVKGVSRDFKKKYSRIPWKQLAGVRDRLIHQYFGVNYDIVWGIIKEELSDLIKEIKKVRAKG